MVHERETCRGNYVLSYMRLVDGVWHGERKQCHGTARAAYASIVAARMAGMATLLEDVQWLWRRVQGETQTGEER